MSTRVVGDVLNELEANLLDAVALVVVDPLVYAYNTEVGHLYVVRRYNDGLASVAWRCYGHWLGVHATLANSPLRVVGAAIFLSVGVLLIGCHR